MPTVVPLKAEPTFEQLREHWPVKWRGDRQRGQRLWSEITSPEGCHTKVKVNDTQSYEERRWIASACRTGRQRQPNPFHKTGNRKSCRFC